MSFANNIHIHIRSSEKLFATLWAVCQSLKIAFHGVFHMLNVLKNYAFLQTERVWLEEHFTFLQLCLHYWS